MMRRLLVLVLAFVGWTSPSSAAPGWCPPRDVRAWDIGSSARGRPIRAWSFGDGPDVTLYCGAFHGDEPLGARLLERLRDELQICDPSWLEGRTVVIVPEVNPDGVGAFTRTNAHGVDLNRNFPTANWRANAPGNRARQGGGSTPASEPETQAVINLVKQIRPRRVVTIHAPLAVVDYDGPGAALASMMARHNGYPTTDYIGYPTPGSFGTYAGKERHIPVITLELSASRDADVLWEEQRRALLDALFWLD